MRNFNNLRTIDLKEYLPGVLKDVAEIRAVMDTETPEIQALWDAAEACMNDQFIQTATEDGIARRESMLGISPYASDTLDDRRFRLQSLYTENVPYTRRSLKNWLETVNKNGYTGLLSQEITASDYYQKPFEADCRNFKMFEPYM